MPTLEYKPRTRNKGTETSLNKMMPSLTRSVAVASKADRTTAAFYTYCIAAEPNSRQ